jgi:hypothetical protein
MAVPSVPKFKAPVPVSGHGDPCSVMLRGTDDFETASGLDGGLWSPLLFSGLFSGFLHLHPTFPGSSAWGGVACFSDCPQHLSLLVLEW